MCPYNPYDDAKYHFPNCVCKGTMLHPRTSDSISIIIFSHTKVHFKIFKNGEAKKKQN